MPQGNPEAYIDPESPDYDPAKYNKAQGDDLLAVLDEAAGRALEPTEIAEFLQSPQGDYVLKNYESSGGLDDTLKAYVMEAYDDWAKKTKTVPTDLMTPQM